ncbi:MAG: 2-oxoglutarate dehydrogenase complex dihydrolipoyllysine-residue succinyltransferase [Polyangiaceae bacterium]|nr:2-oxoglutarate dehydrogenase complex dihydrolipoyllysine-residue succinyltransferase [Polyangiaceae bacterium]
MPLELVVPTVGESITEVQIGEWLKKEGDGVRQDEIVVMIETDKVTVELPAPADGVLTKITMPAGTTAEVGDVVGIMEVGAAPVETSAPSAPSAPAVPGAAAAPPPPPVGAAPVAGGHVMPAAQRAMASAGLSASQVPGTGPGGRVLKEDVAAAAARPQAVVIPPSVPAPTVEAGFREEEVVPMSPMRKMIAKRLVEAQQTAALLTTFNEVDMTAAMAARKQYQDAFTKRYGIKLGFMSFFIKAAVDALQAIPAVNAEIRDTNIVYKNYYDIGVAVGGGKGLVVPVIRNVERLSFAGVEQTIADFGARAKKNQIKLDELQGGTFTISNGGIYGSMMSTPIVNPPQSGILGLHAIQDRAVVVNGQVVVRKMMYIALTYDHRVVDGREAVTFLKRIKECVESPERMLFEV